MLSKDVTASAPEIVEALNRELSQFERIKKFRVLPADRTEVYRMLSRSERSGTDKVAPKRRKL